MSGGIPDEGFVDQARKVREYLIATGSPQAGPLIDALEPIETDPENATAAQMATLYRAAGLAWASVDPATLKIVLASDSSAGFAFGINKETERVWWRRVFNSVNVSVIFGFVLMFFTLYYTLWDVQAGNALARMRGLKDIGHISEMRDMVRSLVEYQADSAEGGDARPPRHAPDLSNTDVIQFIERSQSVQYYDGANFIARAEVSRLLTKASFFSYHYYLVSTWLKGMFSGDPDAIVEGQFLGQKAAGDRTVTQILETCGAENEPCTVYDQYRLFNELLRVIAGELGMTGGVASFSGRQAAVIDQWAAQLVSVQNVVQRWVLPVLYGALGAVIYMIVRGLNPYIARAPVQELFLRTFFGASIGFMVSALFVPSGLYQLEGGGSRPVVFLMCFVFGYSIDSFVRTLERINDYFSRLFRSSQ